MDNKKIKRKIAITNIKRIINSLLFINIMPLFNKVVLGINISKFEQMKPTCYAAPKELFEENVEKIENVVNEDVNLFVILVPIAIIIILAIGLIVGIKRHKNKKMENINNDK